MSAIFAGCDAMILVRPDPRLKLARVLFAHRAAAIDELLLHMRHFRNVKRNRDGGLVRQLQTKLSFAVAFEQRLKFVQCHGENSF
jgi:hypothetical protein